MKNFKESDMIEYFAHMLDESADSSLVMKMPVVIQKLIDEFSNEVVRNPAMAYRLSADDLRRIYDILDLCMFDSKTSSNIKLQYWPEHLIVDKLNEYAVKSGVLDQKYTAAPCYGVHSAVCKDILDDSGNIIDVAISDDIIMINSDAITSCTFIFAVACICHEMIHFYDSIASDEYHNLALKQSQTGKDEDFHNTKIFRAKMKEANENGINVYIPSADDGTYERLNDRAFYVLQSVLPETDERSDTVLVTGKQMVFMKSKKTGKGVLTHFD